MSADPLEEVAGSISDGEPVDWEQTGTGGLDEAELHALRDIERFAQAHRALHESSRAGQGGEVAPERTPTRWGDLSVLELIRAGSSGEVWRAWDPWLQREVALKFLLLGTGPDSSLRDSALLEEARALARVRHPGVVAVHGIAQHDGRLGMWMEFLHGPTLASEIERRGALPVREVAETGLALCRALEAVETAGVVHRDIKPSNVVVESPDRVVLTDFGLGRRWELDHRWRASGTPIFMSPGALAGEPATPRTDIYALGVTLRWALSGHPPFKAHNLEELQAEVRAGPAIPLASERPDAPAALIAAIDRAMAPDAEQRYTGAAQMAAELEKVLRAIDGPRRAPRAIALGASLLVVLGITAFALSRWIAPRGPKTVTRFTVMAPPHMTLDSDPTSATISPDGLTIAFLAIDSSRVTRIWLRPLRSLEARPLGGTDGSTSIFWSPDSRSVAFFSEGKLKKASIAGGAPEVLCAAPDARGATWGRSGSIVFAPIPTGPLSRVSAEGGPVSVVARLDTSRHETALRWPQFLPDGRHFLFVSLPAREGGLDVFVSSLERDERRFILRSDAAPIVAGDHLILARGGRLMAQRFDFQRLRAVGEPVSLGSSTAGDISVGEPLVSASANGLLVQQNAPLVNTRLVWLDRAGRERGTVPLPAGRYERMSFSPDGRRVAVVRRTSPFAVDLWAIDWASGLETRLTSGSQPRIGGKPAWAPDGRRVAFSSNRDGPTNIYAKEVDQGAPERLLYQSSSQFKEVHSWSPDGRYILFEQADPSTAWDIWLLPTRGRPTPIPYLRTSFNEFPLEVSPDGKWLAYWSDESGRAQVYVQSFPRAGEKHLVADVTAGGAQWSSNGRELLLYGDDARIWSVPVVTAPAFHAGRPRVLFKSPADQVWIGATPDAQRFLMCIPVPEGTASTITVEVNWPGELH